MTAGAQGLVAARKLFAHFPDAALRLDDRASAIELVPTEADTFPVTLYDQGDDTMVAAARWHTHYEEPDQAAWCALWLLSPFYRLVEEMKGGVLVATWIERYESTGWEGFEPVYFLNPEHPGSWELQGDETYARRYHQQAVVELPMPYSQFEPDAVLNEHGVPPDFHAGRRVVHDTVSEGLPLFDL